MDTLTHALSGALLARATEPGTPRADQLPRQLRMWVGFWAAAFPDSDFVVNFINSFIYLTTHRGVTHSVILLPLWATGLALLLALIVRRRYSWKAFVATCALGIAAHIAGDVITSFGTMVFAPLSYWRAELSATFIIDLYFSGIIVAGLAASAWWKNSRTPAIAALALLAAYVGSQAILRQQAIDVGESYVAANRLDQTNIDALPQPFSPFNWMVVVEQPKRYHLSYISLWRDEVVSQPPTDAFWLRRVNASYRPAQEALWQQVPRYGTGADAELAEAVWNSDTLARYRHFTLFPALYRVDRGPVRTCVWFNDLRFALVGRVNPFRYGACRAAENPGDIGTKSNTVWGVYRLRHDESGRDLLDAFPN